MATGNETKALIEDFASDLAQALPDPAGWGIWLELLLEELERQAAEQGQPAERYNLTLELLRRSAEERVQGHQL